MKFLFIPISVGGGLVAGAIGKRLFEHVWSWVDEEEPPESSIRRVSVPKLIAAAALEGAIFRVTKSLFDRGSRTAFLNATGSWPGEEAPDRSP